MKRTVSILLFINILFICDLSAQVALKGEVIDKETSEPLSFASVILKSTKDSLCVKSTITDLNGLYSFQNVKTGNYMLIFDLLGYNSKTEMIRITLPSTGYAISRKDTLSCKAFVLDDVTISAVRTQQTSDRRIFTFSRNDLEQVYGSLDLIDTETKFKEDDSLKGSTPYSASKASADLLCLSYYHTYKFPITITRCSNNYGPYQFPEKLIPLIINNVLNNQKVSVHGLGDHVRDWIYVEDHVRGIELVFILAG